MKCLACGSPTTDVKDSRPTIDGLSIRRRRRCPSCGTRMTTVELGVDETRGGGVIVGAGSVRTTALIHLLAQLGPDEASLLIDLARRLAPGATVPLTSIQESRPERYRAAS